MILKKEKKGCVLDNTSILAPRICRQFFKGHQVHLPFRGNLIKRRGESWTLWKKLSSIGMSELTFSNKFLENTRNVFFFLKTVLEICIYLNYSKCSWSFENCFTNPYRLEELNLDWRQMYGKVGEDITLKHLRKKKPC